ncbi:MAG: SEC-C domain-containing protein [Opitutales bacterium]|nr:SEC-C domain-containing protein [Opitutales bacterium]
MTLPVDYQTHTRDLFSQNLLHPDALIRGTCARYLFERPERSPELSRRILEGLEIFGPNAFAGGQGEFGYCPQNLYGSFPFPLDENDFERLITILRSWQPQRSLEAASWFQWARAQPDLSILKSVRGLLRKFSEAPGRRMKAKIDREEESILIKQMELLSKEEPDLRAELTHTLAQLAAADSEETAEVLHGEASQLITRLVQLGSGEFLRPLAHTLFPEHPRDDCPVSEYWQALTAVHLCTHLKLDHYADRLLDLFVIDSDYLLEGLQEAFAAISSPATFEILRKRWPTLPSVAHLYLSNIPCIHHFPECSDFFLEVMEMETEWELGLRSNLAEALAHIARPDTLDAAFNFVLEFSGSEECIDVVKTLRTHFILRGIDDERLDTLEGLIEKEREDRADRRRWLFDRPSPVIASPNKTGRNDPCPCGSGKKFKKCCSKKTSADEEPE